MDFDRAKSALNDADQALESLAYSAPEASTQHQARLARALAAVAEATGLDRGQGRVVSVLLDAANILRRYDHGEAASLVMLAAGSIASGGDVP